MSPLLIFGAAALLGYAIYKSRAPAATQGPPAPPVAQPVIVTAKDDGGSFTLGNEQELRVVLPFPAIGTGYAMSAQTVVLSKGTSRVEYNEDGSLNWVQPFFAVPLSTDQQGILRISRFDNSDASHTNPLQSFTYNISIPRM